MAAVDRRGQKQQCIANKHDGPHPPDCPPCPQIEDGSCGVEARKRHNARELPYLQDSHLAFAQKGQVPHMVEISDRMQMRVIGRR